VLLVKQ